MSNPLTDRNAGIEPHPLHSIPPDGPTQQPMRLSVQNSPLSQPIPLRTTRPLHPPSTLHYKTENIPIAHANISPPSTNQGVTTADQDVDSFLSGPSHRTLIDEPGQLPLLKPAPLPSSLTGIKQLQHLVQYRAWLDVIKVSLELLTASASPYERYYSQLVNGSESDVQTSKEGSDTVGMSPMIQEMIQIIHWRLRALIFLRRYNDLKMEVIRLRLLPSHADTLPSWVPLRLILEGIESTLNATGLENEEQENYDAILDSVYKLREKIDEKDLLFKLDSVLVNILVRKEEWRLALGTLDKMLGYSEEAVKAWLKSNDDSDVLVKAVRIELYSRQGKILLQAGCLPAAATVFERAHDVYQTMSPETDTNDAVASLQGNDLILVKNVPTQIVLNEGLLHFAHIDYDLAEKKFKKAVEFQRVQQRRGGENEARECLAYDGLIDIEGNLLVPCLNNLALCALYTCRLLEAVTMIETLIREDPSKYLTESIAFNLCTLYELGSDNATSEKNKKVLQSIAKRFTLHDIGKENFRLS